MLREPDLDRFMRREGTWSIGPKGDFRVNENWIVEQKDWLKRSRATCPVTYGTGADDEVLTEKQQDNVHRLDQFGKACITARGKMIYLPLMFVKCNLLKRLWQELPNEGRGIVPPCMVSFPHRTQFRREVSLRRFAKFAKFANFQVIFRLNSV